MSRSLEIHHQELPAAALVSRSFEKHKITQAACKMAAVTGVPTHVMNSDRRYHHCDRRQSSQNPTSSSSSSTSTHCFLSHGVANQPILTPLVERRRNSLLAKVRLLMPPSQTNKFLQSKSSQKRKPSVRQIHSLKARSISEAAATESVQRIGAPPPYQRVGDCLVYPSKGKPKGLIHFLGGAFIGAAPDVTYRYVTSSPLLCRVLCNFIEEIHHCCCLLNMI